MLCPLQGALITSVESSKIKEEVLIPSEYQLLPEAFRKRKATYLPPHCQWNCAINLLPQSTPPKGKVYPLLLLEAKAMDKYIEEALAAGYIHPSTSPVAVSFFFVWMKDGGLRPCIGYRGLSAIMLWPSSLPTAY